MKSVEDLPVDKWNDILAVNLSSVFYGIKYVLPSMKARGWGYFPLSYQLVIVVISELFNCLFIEFL